MNDGQAKFFEFLMDAVKDECKDDAKALLEESFKKQADGSFDMEFLQKFHQTVAGYLKDEKREEVMNVLSQFGKQHLS